MERHSSVREWHSDPAGPSECGGRALREFNIDRFVSVLKAEYKNWKVPIVSELAQESSTTPFEVLVSTIISLRTKDEVTAAAASRLFSVARTPREILDLSEEEIEALIYPAGFYHTKAQRLREISTIILENHHGRVPDTIDHLLALPGVGRKTANLVLVEGFDKHGICVDTHVHRISNRIGYVSTRTPEQTESALRKQLPRKYWKRYNEMLVAFGQMICRPLSPFCSTCPVASMCPRIGVDRSR